VLLSVTDQGLGIPPERAEAIFEPGRTFARDPADEPALGHGFGLYIVKGIVEAHGGRIWVEPTSDDRAGATLCVSLPLTPAAAMAPPDATATDGH
jgi:signal transduction histidine kinase